MTTTSTDPETLRARAAEIARGLSEAQREAVLGGSKRGAIAGSLMRLGLIELPPREHPLERVDYRHTSLGLAVLEYLQGNPHDD